MRFLKLETFREANTVFLTTSGRGQVAKAKTGKPLPSLEAWYYPNYVAV